MSETKNVLITGANSGIGKALVLEFAKRGYKVYATDLAISEETKEEFNANYKDLIVTDLLDVTDLKTITKVKQRISQETGNKLHLLYCNAGIVINSHASDITEDDLAKVYNVNLFGCMRMVREFTKFVVNVKGTIVFSGSVTNRLPMHSNALYASTKAALHEYAFVLHSELRNYGVKVHDVVGGAIKTNIFPKQAVEIPEDSVFNFEEYKQIYAERPKVIARVHKDGMEPEEFAKKTLDQIEKANIDTFSIYEGKHATLLHLLGTWLSSKLLINKYLDMFGLNFNYREHLEEETK